MCVLIILTFATLQPKDSYYASSVKIIVDADCEKIIQKLTPTVEIILLYSILDFNIYHKNG